jgi:hypothetical protein
VQGGRSVTSGLRHLCDDSVLLDCRDLPVTPSALGLVIENTVLIGYPVDRVGSIETPETDCRKLADCTRVDCLTPNQSER